MSTAWSEWTWDATRGTHFRYRHNRDGICLFEWLEDQATSAQTPRESQQIDSLAQETQNLNIAPDANYDYQGQDYQLNSGPREKPKSSSSRSKGKDRETGRDRDRDRGKGKGKGKHLYHNDKGSHRAAQVTQATSSHVQAESDHLESSGQGGYDDEQAVAAYYGRSSYEQQTAGHNDVEDEEQQIQQALEASRQMQYGTRTSAGGPSMSPNNTSFAYAYAPDDHESATADEGALYAAQDQFEEIDPRYRIEPSVKFQPGEIFKVYWSEPQGSIERMPSVSGKQEIRNKYGAKFFVGFRRFIVVANDQGHCTCVPILTYGGKGCNKPGVKPAKHGIIHDERSRPRKLHREPEMGFPPVTARITVDGEKLSKESRVNYSKLVTIEHNIRVFFVGRITPDSWVEVEGAVNECWRQKELRQRRS